MNASVAIIIPTYNEEANIIPLLDAIFTHISEPVEICIVDGKSTDRTVTFVQKYILNHPQVSLIQQDNKKGLSAAYIEGMTYMRQRSNICHILTMDADFSHDPTDVISLIKQRHSFDLIIGSRPTHPSASYQKHGVRNLISKLSNLYARTVLSVKIKDLTTGLNIFNIKLLPKDLTKLALAKGFLFQVHLKYHIHKQKGLIHEYPIIFHERRAGKSKFSIWITIEASWKIWLIRFFS